MNSSSENRYGFRVLGNCTNDRRLIDLAAAFEAYCHCDEMADLDQESYLSAFSFGCEFRELLQETGSTKGYCGVSYSRWLWFDIDSEDLEIATDHARRLSMALVERYQLAGDELMIFFSGSKGYHVAVPCSLWATEPSKMFHRYCRKLAESISAWCSVTIDLGIYDSLRCFRAPNSRHPKTGLHKRFLELDQLLMNSVDGIVALAADPMPFEIPDDPAANRAAYTDWQKAKAEADKEIASGQQRRLGASREQLNRATTKFIRDGAINGDRHRMLFSAAADLAGFNCSEQLAQALLSESALDSGLSPSDVNRQILCGLEHGRKRQ